MIKKITQYQLPNISQPKECGENIKVYIDPPQVKLFTKYDNITNQLIINPLIPFLIGSYTVNMLLDNNMGVNASYSFDVVLYDKPRLTKDLIVFEVKIGNLKQFSLPIIEEFQPITVVH